MPRKEAEPSARAGGQVKNRAKTRKRKYGHFQREESEKGLSFLQVSSVRGPTEAEYRKLLFALEPWVPEASLAVMPAEALDDLFVKWLDHQFFE